MSVDFRQLAPWLASLSGRMAAIITVAAAAHLLVWLVLWIWYRRDLRGMATSLDEFTRGLRFRSVLGSSMPLIRQIDAFVADIRDVLRDPTRQEDRQACLMRLRILDERRSYLDSLAFETAVNVTRTMTEAYPLAGVLGTILAIGSALQTSASVDDTAATLSVVVARFGDAIWSTFAGLLAAIVLMFVSSLLETRFERLARSRRHVQDVVAAAKRELGFVTDLTAEDSGSEEQGASD